MSGLTEGYLFSTVDWFSVAESQKSTMMEEIRRFPEHRVMNTSVDDLCNYLIEKYSIDVPVLDEAGIHADRQDTEIDVSRDPNRWMRDPSRPFYVSGTKIEITIPFTGDGEAFKIRPTTASMNPPRALVRGQQLIMNFIGTDLDADQLRGRIQGAVSEIKVHLDRLRNDSAGLHNQLPHLARTNVEGRRQKFLADQNLVASLGFPMKTRADMPQTYRAPEVRRRIQLSPPPVSTAPFKPEPVLATQDYEHILSVMTNMAIVMERSPSAFQSMGEEDLRQHFLVQLNGHYEGQASGETFNYEGKTDILVRSEGRNIFIAECKYWGGSKKLTDTVDQLLGYLSWRDTKAAIVLFNRQRSFTHVLGEIPSTVKVHPNCKRDLGKQSETSFRYVFAHRDDPNREMTVTVLAFDVPQPLGRSPAGQ